MADDERDCEWDDDSWDCDCGDDDCPRCNTNCWHCRGAGFTGDDWDVDPLWDCPGTVMRCPCCGGSGKAKDCWFW